MSGGQMAYLIMAVSAFALYGLVLAWAVWWTRDRRLTETSEPARRLTHPAVRPSPGIRGTAAHGGV